MYAQTLTSSANFGHSSGVPLLLVEDDAPLRQMLSWELADLGYQVCAASDCGEARQIVQRQQLRFALIDVRLPDGDGRELSAEFATDLPALSVILMSAAHDLRPASDHGGHVLAFLGKPVNLACIHRLFSTPGCTAESSDWRLGSGARRVVQQIDRERSLSR